MTLSKLSHKVTHAGVSEELAPTEAKYVVLVNTIALAALLANAYYLVQNFAVGLSLWLSLLPIALAAAYAPTFWLNHRGSHWLATTWLFAVACTTQAMLTLIYGHAAGNYLFFLPIIAAVPLVYPPGHRRSALVLGVISLAIFAAFVLFGQRLEGMVELGPDLTARYRILAFLVLAVFLVIVSYYSHGSTVFAERQLEKRTRELRDALDEVQLSHAQIVESEKQAILGRLVSGLLHEINTPMGVLRSSTDSINTALERCRRLVSDRSSPEDDDARTTQQAVDAAASLCEPLRASCARIVEVTDNLSRFVALDEAERKPVDVRQSIDTALGLLRPVLGDRIRVVRAYPETLSDVMANPAKLNQVFFSLLENATESMDRQGEIRIQVQEGAEGVEIELSDNGRGIPESMLPSLFDFGWTHKGERMRMRLGLPLSKRNTEDNGGRITLVSTEGVGTTVRVVFPAAT